MCTVAVVGALRRGEEDVDALLREEHVPKLKARRFRRALREDFYGAQARVRACEALMDDLDDARERWERGT